MPPNDVFTTIFVIAGTVVVLGVIAAIIMSFAANSGIAQEWERVVIMRLGRFHAVKGPGLFFITPGIDTIVRRVDTRMTTTPIEAEHALTMDMVSVRVDAVVFWQVVDAELAIMRLRNFESAISQIAQTSLREMIGKTDLGALANRTRADQTLKEIIGNKVSEWGINLDRVEIRDVTIPVELEDAMSRQAQASRESDARKTLANAEVAIAEASVKAAAIYEKSPGAYQLRQMNVLAEMAKDRGSTILIPTDMIHSFGPMGLAAMVRNAEATAAPQPASSVAAEAPDRRP